MTNRRLATACLSQASLRATARRRRARGTQRQTTGRRPRGFRRRTVIRLRATGSLRQARCLLLGSGPRHGHRRSVRARASVPTRARQPLGIRRRTPRLRWRRGRRRGTHRRGTRRRATRLRTMRRRTNRHRTVRRRTTRRRHHRGSAPTRAPHRRATPRPTNPLRGLPVGSGPRTSRRQLGVCPSRGRRRRVQPGLRPRHHRQPCRWSSRPRSPSRRPGPAPTRCVASVERPRRRSPNPNRRPKAGRSLGRSAGGSRAQHRSAAWSP